MTSNDFEYDVAFSFVAQDEALATQLADQFEGKQRVFLYSRRQEQLAGTDGEKSFNDVFSLKSRLVVVLFRDGWGQTPWTRIEETAIRNRGFEEGYEFVIFIPLDEKPAVPKWLPRNRLWIGLKRWGISGAASVIDARIQELGGESGEESLENQAVRAERANLFAAARKSYLNSEVGVRASIAEFEVLRNALIKAIPQLQASAPSLSITEKNVDNRVVLLSKGPCLSVQWRYKYSNTLSDSSLDVDLWESHPPFPGLEFWDRPTPISSFQAMADIAPPNTPAWTFTQSGSVQTLHSDDAAEFILKWWLAKVLKHCNRT